MFLGVDLGTSAVKAALLDAAGTVAAQASAPLEVSRPRPRWSEQDPGDWWRAATRAVRGLPETLRARVAAVGLSGQMHGAVLLDGEGRVLRPAILWNDGRAAAECAVLDAAARRVAGNRAMAGFTAPKLLWARAHEPDIFAATRRVLLPKDWLRLRLTGEAVSDMSDAAGTLWLDVARRDWSEEMLELTGLSRAAMPRLVEGSGVSGVVTAEDWGIPRGIPVAGGAGDNAAGAVGLGCVEPGDAFVSLGTSGVIFVADAAPRPDPARTVHAFCHALPGLWHRMAVILSAGGALAWAATVLGVEEAVLAREAEAAGPGRVLFLPYLAGERTPHDDAASCGVWFGLEAGTTRCQMARAVMQGVAFALADGLAALEAEGGRIPRLALIGGGARSSLWARLLAAALDRPLDLVADPGVGPALGAARLAMIAAGAEAREVCAKPPVTGEVLPDPERAEGRDAWNRLYPLLRPLMQETAR
ncbi:MAG: xylulokinase [Acetobacteraceae bacterium]|nr:xylulokinase [Acetobacteraceae bacterium]